ncbi:hypothetical protein Csa_004697 [Cucumis sativus]|uniref:Uncharacterized protein n=1 Tax=Cucumis sativus TaxID=3659 RepID=A0A0A0KMD4_CUCSA|nr:hypothetical protein Csa_004697 [Cucumis sativus]
MSAGVDPHDDCKFVGDNQGNIASFEENDNNNEHRKEEDSIEFSKDWGVIDSCVMVKKRKSKPRLRMP